MVLRLLQFLLLLVVIRALWKLARGVLEGAGFQRVDQVEKPRVTLSRDPICGVYVSPVKALASRYGGETIYFCSEKCQSAWARGRTP